MNGASRSRAALALVVAALFVTPAAALTVPGSAPTAQQATNETVQPGEQLAGVVGVQGAEIDGAIEGRAFGQAIAAANSNESKAAVVAERLDGLETRLEELRQRRAELQQAYENGTLERGQYRSRVAQVAARIHQTERLLNRSHSVAADLPEQARSAAGLNVTAIETLRSQARELRGGEVAEIARTIAGPGVGRGMPDTPGGGPPEGVPGNGPGKANDSDGTTTEPGESGNGNASQPGQSDGGKPDSPGQSDGGKPDSPGQSGDRGAGQRTTTTTDG